jgi:hypothetical protein
MRQSPADRKSQRPDAAKGGKESGGDSRRWGKRRHLTLRHASLQMTPRSCRGLAAVTSPGPNGPSFRPSPRDICSQALTCGIGQGTVGSSTRRAVRTNDGCVLRLPIPLLVPPGRGLRHPATAGASGFARVRGGYVGDGVPAGEVGRRGRASIHRNSF